ncbi:MAG: AsnC family transcriptional regulator [Gemmatimonas sp.]|nr:AsnC family transcriptional regulator [Gemmatimonas sp.]
MQGLDDVDRAIISQLQEDGRRSFRSIAGSLGVSEATVRSRVRRLQDQGAMRILAFVDPYRFGYQVSASVQLRVDPEHHDEVVAALAEWNEIVYLSSTTGRSNVYAHLIADSRSALLRSLTDGLAQLPGVEVEETILELEIHKARYIYTGDSGRRSAD